MLDKEQKHTGMFWQKNHFLATIFHINIKNALPGAGLSA